MSKKILQYTIQALWILYFYLLGIGISFLIGGFLPGSVIGMLLLFGALCLGWIKPKHVEGSAKLLIGNMVLFFLPPAVGIITAWDKISDHLVPIIIAMMVSTVAVIIAVGLLQQTLMRKLKK